VKLDATAGLVARGATIVYVGGEEGAGRRDSTQSAMRCRESSPFSAWSLVWRVVHVLAAGKKGSTAAGGNDLAGGSDGARNKRPARGGRWDDD
jgi:hypothetical protein